jgi:hypothetical protein
MLFVTKILFSRRLSIRICANRARQLDFFFFQFLNSILSLLKKTWYRRPLSLNLNRCWALNCNSLLFLHRNCACEGLVICPDSFNLSLDKLNIRVLRVRMIRLKQTFNLLNKVPHLFLLSKIFYVLEKLYLSHPI